MPDCDLVEVIDKGPIEVAAYGITAASATDAAFQLAEQRVEKEFVQWLDAPCPSACPGKLLRNPHAHIRHKSRPPAQEGDWWIGYASYDYGGAALCFGGEVFDAIQLSQAIPAGSINVVTGESEQEAKCGLNVLYLNDLQEAGNLEKTKEAAEKSARQEAKRAAERWFQERMQNVSCSSPCTNQVRFFEITTRVILIGQFKPGEEWAGIAQASGTGYIYCLDDDTWAKLIDDLTQRRVIADPSGLLPN